MIIEYMKVPVRNKSLTIMHRFQDDAVNYSWKEEVVIEDVTKEKYCSECVIKDRLQKIYGNNITIEELLYG